MSISEAMTISQLITKLETERAKHGDLPVLVSDLPDEPGAPRRKDQVSNVCVGDFQFINAQGNAVNAKSIHLS
jgi:hypothetical protein